MLEETKALKEVTCLMLFEKLVTVVKSKLSFPHSYSKLLTATSTYIQSFWTLPTDSANKRRFKAK